MDDVEKTEKQAVHKPGGGTTQSKTKDNYRKRLYYVKKAISGELDRPNAGRQWLESSLKHFFELSSDIFLIMDFNGYIKQVNKAVEKVLGYRREEILSKSVMEFFYQSGLDEQTAAKLKNIITGPPVTTRHVNRYRCKDGSYRWLEWSAVPVFPESLVYAVAHDITGQKDMEEQLKKSNQQIASILESITDAFYALDKKWRFTYINKEALRWINIPLEEIIGKSIWEVWPEDVGKKIYKEFHRAMLEQVPVHFEEQSVHRGQWYEVHAYPSPNGLSVYSQYITGRKQAEKKLRLNESRLNALLKLNQMTGATIDEICNFAYTEGIRLTESTMGFLGFINEDETMMATYYRPMNVMEQCHISERPVFFPIKESGLWAEAVRQRRPVLVNDYAAQCPFKKGCPKGHVTLTRILVIPVFDGGRIVMVAAVANKMEDYNESDVHQLELLMSGAWKIIQRKHAEEALRLSEERFYKAFHASPNIMAIVSLDNSTYIDVNESFMHTFGYSREETLGRTAIELNIWAEPDEKNEMLNMFNRQGMCRNLEVRAKTRLGKERLLLISGETITVNNEKCLLLVAQDITEYKQLEKEMARLDRLNLVGEMAAGIGHEIRNPLTTVRGFLQLLGIRNEFRLSKDYFDLMIEEMDRANSIITEFLSLARNKSVELEKKNINTIIKSLFLLLQADALENDKQVELELSCTPELYLDEKEIRQLILNLVRNGLEATPKGKCLLIKTLTDGDCVVLAVQDEGEGIPAEILERIGTPFLSTKDNGIGLGLAVCYSIAERHRAKIDIKTGRTGTTFWVRFKAREK